jgi:hypothetical protein
MAIKRLSYFVSERPDMREKDKKERKIKAY